MGVGKGPALGRRHDELPLVDEPGERGVDGVERQAGARGDPARVGAEGRTAREPHDRVGVVLLAGIGGVGGGEVELTAEVAHHFRREHAAATQELGKRRVVGAEIAREGAQRVACIALAALLKFGGESLSQIHARDL